MIKVVTTKSQEKRPYGKAPLELDLPQALEAVGRIAAEGRSLPESKLAVLLGNTVTSSAFTRKLRALSAYGLIAEQIGAQFMLTELALAVALPRSPQARLEAIKQAFLRIEPFAALFNQHKGKLLPADEFLRNILEHESGIPRDLSQQWVNHFKAGAESAGLFHNRGDGKIQIAESPVLPIEIATTTIPETGPSWNDQARLDGDGSTGFTLGGHRQSEVPIWAMGASGHCTRIDLSDGRRAEFRIPDRLNARDAQKLQRALDGIKAIIDSMVSDDK